MRQSDAVLVQDATLLCAMATSDEASDAEVDVRGIWTNMDGLEYKMAKRCILVTG